MRLIFTLLLFGLAFQASAEEWITEEVLKQLSEVRQELKLLRNDVNALQESIQGGAPRPEGQQKRGFSAIDLELGNTPYIGDESAQIAIVEFSDYQCPYCKRHYKQTLPSIAENYIDTGNVKYFMKQFPLGFHSAAKGAAISALCVESHKKGSYWRAHEALFSGEVELNKAAYLNMAESFGLDITSYQACLENPEIGEIVDKDMRDGEKAGISGTPAFLVGRLKDGRLVGAELITGARPYSSFSSALNELLN